jgi:hypothetical protein
MQRMNIYAKMVYIYTLSFPQVFPQAVSFQQVFHRVFHRLGKQLFTNNWQYLEKIGSNLNS